MFRSSLIILLCCSLSVSAVAQLPPRFFDNLRMVPQTEKIIAENPKLGLRLVRLSDDRDTAASFASFFARKRGEQFVQDGYRYKVLERDQFNGLRCSYVFLDGDKLSFSQIENIRRQVMDAYRTGTPFAELVTKYGMDGNPTGDTDWFREDQMVKDFEDAVRDHKAGDLFTLDIPDKRWYYVVLKTHSNRLVRRVSLAMARAGE